MDRGQRAARLLARALLPRCPSCERASVLRSWLAFDLVFRPSVPGDFDRSPDS